MCDQITGSDGDEIAPEPAPTDGRQEGGGENGEPCDVDETVRRLLGSISSGRLTIFCGAGLSMGEPSNLPSAAALVDKLKARYIQDRGTPLPDEAGQDIEQIAAWALDNAPEFSNFFIPTIRSPSFFHPPNQGHEAIADFLLTEAINSAISTNVDHLIEEAARELGEYDFRAIVEDTHLTRAHNHSPLVKLHGCFRHEEEHTVWCEEQLVQAPIRRRIEAFRQWMEVQLPGNDLLIVGYWTDWPYLNETFTRSIQDIHPRSVTLVNPDSPENLEKKAKELWEWIQQSGDVNFHHVPVGGNELMNHLRLAYSQRFFRRLLETVQGGAMVQQYYGVPSTGDAHMPPFENMDMDDMYALRRDFAGVPEGRPVRDGEPSAAHHEQIGALHELLMERSAFMEGRLYRVGDRALRLVNSRGRPLGRVKREFARSETASRGVAYVCVGTRSSMPGRPDVVREFEGDDVVRSGMSPEWWTDDDLFEHLDQLNDQEES